MEQLLFSTYFGLADKGVLIDNASEVIQQRVNAAGDMEANNWNFEQWCEWMKVEFPEIWNWKPNAQAIEEEEEEDEVQQISL